MSNPGVIVLGSCETKSGGNFRVEDNIGECIHIHYANFRFDFSIEEFLDLEAQILNAFSSLLSIENFDVEDFDINFIAAIGDKLIDLKEIKYEMISLSDLKVFKSRYGVPSFVNISKSIMLNALKGNDKDYVSYNQINSFEEDNVSRLKRVQEYVMKNDKIKPIILFNDQNIIRDGQHRASVLFNLGKNEVKVVRLIFRKKKHNLSNYPVLDYAFKWDLERMKNVYRWGRNKINNLKKRAGHKMRRTFHKFS